MVPHCLLAFSTHALCESLVLILTTPLYRRHLAKLLRKKVSNIFVVEIHFIRVFSKSEIKRKLDLCKAIHKQDFQRCQYELHYEAQAPNKLLTRTDIELLALPFRSSMRARPLSLKRIERGNENRTYIFRNFLLLPVLILTLYNRIISHKI